MSLVLARIYVSYNHLCNSDIPAYSLEYKYTPPSTTPLFLIYIRSYLVVFNFRFFSRETVHENIVNPSDDGHSYWWEVSLLKHELDNDQVKVLFIVDRYTLSIIFCNFSLSIFSIFNK